MTSQAIFLTLAFACGFMLVFGLNMIVVDVFENRRKEDRKRLEKELRKKSRDRARGAMENNELYEMAAEGAVDLSKHKTMKERLAQLIEQSGSSINAIHLVVFTIIMAAVPGALTYLLYPSWMAAVTLAFIFGMLPSLYVIWLRNRRMNLLLSQLPDSFELMSRVIRSGQTISQAIQAVADEYSAPVAEEFGYCHEQQNLGLSPEAALRDLARRTGLLEIRIFVVAVSIHRQSGGNLSDLLDSIASVIRDRFRIRGQIRALTAEGRMQAVILLALPPLMLVILLIVNRAYMMTIFEYPSLLVGMFVCEGLGAAWMRKIVNFEI